MRAGNVIEARFGRLQQPPASPLDDGTSRGRSTRAVSEHHSDYSEPLVLVELHTLEAALDAIEARFVVCAKWFGIGAVAGFIAGVLLHSVH